MKKESLQNLKKSNFFNPISMGTNIHISALGRKFFFFILYIAMRAISTIRAFSVPADM